MLFFVRNTLAFLRKDFKTDASYRLSFVFKILSVLFPLFTFYFLGQMFGSQPNAHLQRYGGSYFPFILVGIAVQNMTSTAMYSFSQRIQQSQSTGTLEALIATHAPVGQMIVQMSLYDLLFSSARLLLTLALGMWVFQVSFASANVMLTLLFFLLSIGAFAAVGVLSASFLIVFKRGDPVTGIFGILSSMLGGVYFPITLFPAWVQVICKLLPITYALEGLRMTLLRGASFQEMTPALLGLVLFILVAGPLSILAFHGALRIARKDGTLGQF